MYLYFSKLQFPTRKISKEIFSYISFFPSIFFFFTLLTLIFFYHMSILNCSMPIDLLCPDCPTDTKLNIKIYSSNSLVTTHVMKCHHFDWDRRGDQKWKIIIEGKALSLGKLKVQCKFKLSNNMFFCLFLLVVVC